MHEFYIVMKALFAGLFTGFVVAIPLGPAGLESVKRTISNGYKEGFLISLGAVCGDAFDLVLINFGLFNLFSVNRHTKAVFWIISGMILAGISYISIKKAKKGDDITIHSGFLDTEKERTKSIPFITGFLIVLSNPLNHSLWITMSGTVIMVWHHAGRLPYYTFVLAILMGSVLWFALLNLFALKSHKKISAKSSGKITFLLMWSVFIIGLCFIAFGLYRLLFR